MKALKFILAWNVVAIMILFTACNNDLEEKTNLDQLLEDQLVLASGGLGASYYQLPESDDYEKIPQDPRNELTKEKVELGKLLYHETALGLDPEISIGEGTYSCASCHHADAGFQAGIKQGIGEGGIGFGDHGEGRVINKEYTSKALDVQPIKSPSTLNVAYQENMLWNGQFGVTGLNEGTEYAWWTNTPREENFLGYHGVETQAIAGMETHHMIIGNFFVKDIPGYKELFDKAFPDEPEEERCNTVNAGLAIAAYERILLPHKAPFQRWLKGEKKAMTPEEKEGALLFFGKADCYSCHNGPALNSMEFYGLGMKDLYEAGNEIVNASKFSLENKGRGGFTGKQEDMFKFKVPQLYNLKEAGFYGHGASFNSIYEVVKYKNEAIPENDLVPESALAEEFKPLNLSEEEIEKITLFIENSLNDPDLHRYVPESLPSGNCFPNNDPQSQIDLGCQ